MREFLWGYFCRTGVIDAYLLYKKHESTEQCGSGTAFSISGKHRSVRGRPGVERD